MVASGSGDLNGGGSDDSGPAEFSDAGNQDIPPTIRSSNGGFIQQPTERVPVLGLFEIKSAAARLHPTAPTPPSPPHSSTAPRSVNSCTPLRPTAWSHFVFARSELRLWAAVTSCTSFCNLHLPFPFLFIFYSSQAAAAWISNNLMSTGLCSETPVQHIVLLLGWRYTRPLVPGDLDDSDESDDTATQQDIDRAVLPKDYVHHEGSRLKYNQPVDA